jgi:NAD+ synthase
VATYALPAELLIDTAIARRIIAEFVRGHLRQTGFERVIMNLSGGLDSALVAFLGQAIGPDPCSACCCRTAPRHSESRADAETVVAQQLPQHADRHHAHRRRLPETALGGEDRRVRRGTSRRGARMAVLYDRSVGWGGLVAGTGNKTEWLIGYTTMYGDNACAFSPIGDLYKSQVRQLAAAVGVPEAIIRKAPSADLWPGRRTNELGMTMRTRDRLLYWQNAGGARQPRRWAKRRRSAVERLSRSSSAPDAAGGKLTAHPGRRPLSGVRRRYEGLTKTTAGWGMLYAVATPTATRDVCCAHRGARGAAVAQRTRGAACSRATTSARGSSRSTPIPAPRGWRRCSSTLRAAATWPLSPMRARRS